MAMLLLQRTAREEDSLHTPVEFFYLLATIVGTEWKQKGTAAAATTATTTSSSSSSPTAAATAYTSRRETQSQKLAYHDVGFDRTSHVWGLVCDRLLVS